MNPRAPRLYVTGRVVVELADGVLDEADFPSRQARLLFACLAVERSRAVAREELAEILWPDRMPAAWDSALKVLVSKLRRALPAVRIPTEFGRYRLELPPGSWLDWEAASRALDESEGALRAGEPRKAWGAANVAVVIGRRGFLPGEHGAWIEARRRELGSLLVRALTGYAEICLASDQAEVAAQVSEEAIERAPFRESGYQLLMQAQAALGNRAEATRVYHRCRELLLEELGVSPSPATEALYLKLLRGGN